MDYRETVKKLGEDLLQTPQYEALETARRNLEEDVSAQVLLQSLDELRDELMSLRRQGGEIPREARAKAEKLNEKMAANSALKEYRRAQVSFGEVMGQVREELEEKTGVPFPAGCGGCPQKG